MEFQDVVRRRKMVRSFRPDTVPAEVIERVLENALHAPSAGFSQGWAFLLLEGPGQTSRFWDATLPTAADREHFGHPGLLGAPVIVVPLSHEQAYRDRYAEPDKGVPLDAQDDFWPVPFWHIDTGFAAMLMLLTAVDAGLGALFFGIFPERVDGFRAEFGVPAAYTPIGAIALGLPAGDDRPSPSLQRGRRPVADVVHRGQW